MEHVDLQRRQEDHARTRGKSENSEPGISRDPLFLVGIGFVLGSAVSFFLAAQMGMFGFSAVLPFLVAVALFVYVVWLLVRKDPAEIGPKLGSEKQLLMAIQTADDGITPVEAALETSLTVGEAEDILTRFAERGHLRVESREGVLLYALPSRRSTREPRTV